jgi:2-dehydro-3-deoxy-D-gluconate 5-dehydrogenase
VNRELASWFSMRGTTGIVTGGSSGLGLAMVRLLARAGAQVHAFSRSGRPRDGRRTRGVTHHAVDVTDSERQAERVRSIGRASGLDFVVGNAGITLRAPFARGAPADWERIHAVNVAAAADLAQQAYPFLKRSQHPGRLVLITSMAAHLGFSEVVPYGVSKAALLGLMRGLAVEWAPDGILVNSVAPGWFPSEMTHRVMDPARKKRILARMPLHRFGRADELASAVLFLLSPAATYITGHDLAVDGGALAFGF